MSDDQLSVRWGVIENALQVVSPERALRRYKHKLAAAQLRRKYEAAQKGRGTDGWHTGATAADSEIAAAGPLLRDRMRDLVRNNPLAAQAVQVLVNNIVGPGIRPRAASMDKELNKRVDALFERWSKQCDAHGHTDFFGLQQLAVREMIEGGDVFALRRAGRRKSTGIAPLEIELKEADHLDDGRVNWEQSGARISRGIEYDAQGKRRAYWMFPEHPGDNVPGQWRSITSVRVPADNVAHLFERQRVQSRGVPWGVPAMRALRDLGDWQDAELTRKKIEASAVGVVFGDPDLQDKSIAPVVRDAQGNAVEQFEPGMFFYAEGATDIKFNAPSATPGIREWNLVQMHIISSGFRVPYALMTGDFSQFNFSSSRAALNEFRRMIDAVQWLIIIPMICEVWWRWFIEAAWTAGLLEVEEVPVEWQPPAFESVNPFQDAQTDLLEVRAGFASLKQKVAQRGYAYSTVLAEQAEALAEADNAKLVLDSDPRKTSRAGLTQARQPGAELPDTGGEGDSGAGQD